MIQFKYYNEGATFDASLLNNEDIAFVEDENALYTHGKKFKFADPTPIPVEGAVQVFANLQCTEYITGGTIQEVYVRLNRAFGFGDRVDYGNASVAGSRLVVYTPTDVDPTDTYMVEAYVDFHNVSSQEPFVAGQVIKCTASNPVNVTNPQTVFGEL